MKSMKMDIWVVSTTNQIFRRGSHTETKFSKNKVVTDRTLLQVYFVLPILLVLTMASDKAILFENVALSILIYLTKKQYSSFLIKVFFFQKIYFKVKLLKTFKISCGCHIKTCRSHNWRAVSKIPSTIFQKNPCSFS